MTDQLMDIVDNDSSQKDVVVLILVAVVYLLASGSVGDNDLWYYHLQGNGLFCLSLFLSLRPPHWPPSWLRGPS